MSYNDLSALLLPIYPLPGRDLCLESWSLSQRKWVLRDQATYFTIAEIETSGGWNLPEISNGEPVSQPYSTGKEGRPSGLLEASASVKLKFPLGSDD